MKDREASTFSCTPSTADIRRADPLRSIVHIVDAKRAPCGLGGCLCVVSCVSSCRDDVARSLPPPSIKMLLFTPMRLSLTCPIVADRWEPTVANTIDIVISRWANTIDIVMSR